MSETKQLYTQSATIDKISKFFTTYKGENREYPAGQYYFEIFWEGGVHGKEVAVEAYRLKPLEYLFEDLDQGQIKNLVGKAAIKFLKENRPVLVIDAIDKEKRLVLLLV